MDTPLALIAASRVRFWLWQYQAQKAVGAKRSHETVESPLRPPGVGAALAYRSGAASGHVLADCGREAPRLVQILCVRVVGQPANETGRGVVQLPVDQETAHYIGAFALQQAGQVVEHPTRSSAGSREDEGALLVQRRQTS